jgi:hypothetical protein
MTLFCSVGKEDFVFITNSLNLDIEKNECNARMILVAENRRLTYSLHQVFNLTWSSSLCKPLDENVIHCLLPILQPE